MDNIGEVLFVILFFGMLYFVSKHIEIIIGICTSLGLLGALAALVSFLTGLNIWIAAIICTSLVVLIFLILNYYEPQPGQKFINKVTEFCEEEAKLMKILDNKLKDKENEFAEISVLNLDGNYLRIEKCTYKSHKVFSHVVGGRFVSDISKPYYSYLDKPYYNYYKHFIVQDE